MASRPEHMPPWQTWGWKMMVSRPEHIKERKEGKLHKRGDAAVLQTRKTSSREAQKEKRERRTAMTLT